MSFFVLFCHILFSLFFISFLTLFYQPPFALAFYTLLPFAPFALHCFLLLPLLWPFFIFIYSIPLFSFPSLLSHTAIHFPFTHFLPLSTFSSFASSDSKCWHHAQIKMLIKAALPSFLLFSCSFISPLTSFFTPFFFLLGFSRLDQTAWLHQLYGQSML